MKAFRIILVKGLSFKSVFQFLVRYGCIKSGKIKRLDACYTVESWRFKMF